MEIKHKKYASIENSYREKYIQRLLDWNPKVADFQYVITEKIDGSNIQLLFSPKEKYKVGKRSCFLSEGENFYDIWGTLEKHKDLTDRLQNYVDTFNCSVRVYGELYGEGVQKRINYGEGKKISLFDVVLIEEGKEKILSQLEMQKFMSQNGLMRYSVPVFKILSNLSQALDFDVDGLASILSPSKDNVEGVVIKPYTEVTFDYNGGLFYLKKKSEAFEEKMSSKKVKVQKEPVSGELIQLQSEFREYINKNRLLSVFSKEGEIEDPTQIGKYLGLLVNDAKEDFIKDHPEVTKMEKKEQKIVFNIGPLAVKLLREYL